MRCWFGSVRSLRSASQRSGGGAVFINCVSATAQGEDAHNDLRVPHLATTTWVFATFGDPRSCSSIGALAIALPLPPLSVKASTHRSFTLHCPIKPIGFTKFDEDPGGYELVCKELTEELLCPEGARSLIPPALTMISRTLPS